MARLIFDSSVLVAGHRGEGLSGLVAEHEEDVAIAAVTVAELRMGAHRGHATRAVPGITSGPTCTTTSGSAARFTNQSGSLGAPLNEATTM